MKRNEVSERCVGVGCQHRLNGILIQDNWMAAPVLPYGASRPSVVKQRPDEGRAPARTVNRSHHRTTNMNVQRTKALQPDLETPRSSLFRFRIHHRDDV